MLALGLLSPEEPLRLGPSGRLESKMSLADRVGRRAASARIAAAIPGLDLAVLYQRCGSLTPSLHRVSDSFLADLATEQELDRVLMSLDCQPGFVRLVDGNGDVERLAEVIRPSRAEADGPRLRPLGLLDALEHGQTLIANNLGLKTGGVVARFINDVERVSANAVGLNVYVSEREAVGFGRHWDDHDVIIIQGLGAKKWTIFEPVHLAPSRGYVPSAASGKAVITTVLEPGQALFIPRGWSHEVAGFPGEVSLHYTISVKPPSVTDLLQRLAERTRAATGGARPRPVSDRLCLDRRTLESELASLRAGLRSEPMVGPFEMDATRQGDWQNAVLSAPLPGGVVFVDPEHGGQEADRSSVTIAVGQCALTLDEQGVDLVAHLATEHRTTVDRMVLETGIERAEIASAITTLVSHEIVHVVPSR